MFYDLEVTHLVSYHIRYENFQFVFILRSKFNIQNVRRQIRYDKNSIARATSHRRGRSRRDQFHPSEQSAQHGHAVRHQQFVYTQGVAPKSLHGAHAVQQQRQHPEQDRPARVLGDRREPSTHGDRLLRLVQPVRSAGAQPAGPRRHPNESHRRLFGILLAVLHAEHAGGVAARHFSGVRATDVLAVLHQEVCDQE